LGPLIASAGILGVALGLGAQTLVRDVLSGIFMLVEDQYGVGDQVDVLDVQGVVEKVGLRVTCVRDKKGTLWYLRNGEILKVGNQSQSG
jgi:small-conductance mechanosensitive channel